ncbi:MAG TPA: hypothetical protein VIM79_10890 [Niastella sp.]
MNERTSYEILISEKAAQCTVPDMADNIWSAIDAGLQASPANANNNDHGQLNAANHAGNWLGWGKLSLFIAGGCIAIITIVALLLRESNKPNNKIYPVQPEHQSAPAQPAKGSAHLDSVERKKTTPAFSPTVKNTPVILPDSTLIKKDSAMNMPIIIPPIVDSGMASPQQQQPDSSITTPKNKKPRGVRGINPDDYKIIPFKKDSTNAKQ